MTQPPLWSSIDGGNEAKADRVCYVATWTQAELELVDVDTIRRGGSRGWVPRPVVVERPKYDGRIARGVPPGIVIDLSWNTAAVAYGLAGGEPVTEYTTDDWIGGTKKHALHLRIWAALTPAERAVVGAFASAKDKGKTWTTCEAAINRAADQAARGAPPLKHPWFNILDAVGVGLFHQQRIGKGGARPTR